jgi:hypothetical protein
MAAWPGGGGRRGDGTSEGSRRDTSDESQRDRIENGAGLRRGILVGIDLRTLR